MTPLPDGPSAFRALLGGIVASPQDRVRQEMERLALVRAAADAYAAPPPAGPAALTGAQVRRIPADTRGKEETSTMRIEHPAVPAAQTPEPTLRRAADSTTPVPTPERGTPRQDSVEISEDARGLALRDSAALERLTLIRERVASGFYDTPTVLDAVAARVLASGDL